MRICMVHKNEEEEFGLGFVFALSFFFSAFGTLALRGRGRLWERREEILKREREREREREKALGATKKKGKGRKKNKNVHESSVSRAVVVHRRERVGTKAVARCDRRKRRRSFV